MLATILSAISALAASIAAWAATRQSKVMKEQFVSDQRAWISFKPRADGDLTWYETGCDMKIAIKIANIGKSPATEVCTYVKEIFGYRNLSSELEKFAASVKKSLPDSSRILIPSDSYDRPWGITFPREEQGTIFPVIMVCVNYKILYDAEIHQTAATYSLGKTNGDLIETTDDVVALKDIEFESSSGGIVS